MDGDFAHVDGSTRTESMVNVGLHADYLVREARAKTSGLYLVRPHSKCPHRIQLNRVVIEASINTRFFRVNIQFGSKSTKMQCIFDLKIIKILSNFNVYLQFKL